jgi:hypothetical protein
MPTSATQHQAIIKERKEKEKRDKDLRKVSSGDISLSVHSSSATMSNSSSQIEMTKEATAPRKSASKQTTLSLPMVR